MTPSSPKTLRIMTSDRFLNTKNLQFILLFSGLAMLAVFFYNTSWYLFMPDDFLYISRTRAHGFAEYMQFFYANINGRWFCNALCFPIFSALGLKAGMYWVAQITQLLLFVLSLAFFLRSIVSYFSNTTIKKSLSYIAAFFFTAIFYWFFFDGRVEVWYWEPSCVLYLFSYMLIFWLYGFLYAAGNKSLQYVPIVLLAFFIGGLSETNALSCFFISAFLAFGSRARKKIGTSHLLICIFILLSLLIGALSPGLAFRESALPEPSVVSAIKNGLNTIYIHLSRFKHIPFKIGALVLLYFFYLWLKDRSGIKEAVIKKFGAGEIILLVLLVVINLFVPAYYTSRETPDRVMAALYLLTLFLLLNFFIRKPARQRTEHIKAGADRTA